MDVQQGNDNTVGSKRKKKGGKKKKRSEFRVLVFSKSSMRAKSEWQMSAQSGNFKNRIIQQNQWLQSTFFCPQGEASSRAAYLMLISPCTVTMAAQSRSGRMRPGGLGSTQLIQKLAQLAWYWWPPYSSLKLSVSELNACPSEKVKY